MAVLYGIGVGPGDPELLTVKAARVLQSVPVVAGPVARLDGDSYALSIVSELLQPGQDVLKLHFPMIRDLEKRKVKRQAAAQALLEQLGQGRDVAFVTEGDPLLHSTFGYILEYLPEDTQVEVIPGVSSIMAAAAESKLPLIQANQTLAVIPAASNRLAELEQVLHDFDTIVLIKANRVLDKIIALLEQLDLLDKAILVERASHADSRVVTNLKDLEVDKPHYLSLVIVRKGNNADED